MYDHTAILPVEYVEAFERFIESDMPGGKLGARASLLQRLDEILVELGLPAERPEEYVHNEDCSERRGVGRSRCRDRREDRRNARNAEIEAYDAQRSELLEEAEARASTAREAYREARGNGHRNRVDDEPPIRDDAA